MSVIVTRAGKGAPLSWVEADANFTNLNNDKLEAGTPATNIAVTPTGGILATDVQAALAELDTELSGTVTKTASTGAAVIPTGTTANRPEVPTEGHFRRNSELGQWEGYDGSKWSGIGGASGGFRNILINGGMQVAQRGTTFTPTVQGTYTLDRWSAYLTQPSKFAVAQGTDTSASGALLANYASIVSQSAYTVLSTDGFAFQQKIEGSQLQGLLWGAANAKPVTLSFRVNSSLTGTFGGSIYNAAGNRFYPFSYVIPVAGAETAISVTIPGDTSGDWPIGNVLGAVVSFGLGAGASLSQPAGAWTANAAITSTGARSLVATNGASIAISAVQLEEGSFATPFEKRPVGLEISLCERYYENVTGVALTTLYSTFMMRQTKRAIPTLSLISISTGIGFGATPVDAKSIYQSTAHSINASFSLAASAEL